MTAASQINSKNSARQTKCEFSNNNSVLWRFGWVAGKASGL